MMEATPRMANQEGVVGRKFGLVHLAMFSCFLLSVSEGIMSTLLAMSTVSSGVTVNTIQEGAITLGGTFLCLILCLFFGDKLGRQKMILVTATACLVGTLINLINMSFTILLLSRCFAGIASGLVFVYVPIYLCEIASTKRRGAAVLLMGLGGTIGKFLALGLIEIWPVSAVLILLIGVTALHVISFAFMPESPYYLMMKNQQDKAVKSIVTLWGVRRATSEIERIRHTVEEEKRKAAAQRWPFDARNNEYSHSILAVCVLVLQLGRVEIYAAFVQILYLHPADAMYVLVPLHVLTAAVLAIVIVILLVDKIGRKVFLVFSGELAGICAVVLTVYTVMQEKFNADPHNYAYSFAWLVLIHSFALNLGIATIPYILIGELFPTAVRTKAASIFIMSNVGLQFAMPLLVSRLYAHIGIYPFFILSSVVLIFFTLLFAMQPETKKKEFLEIQEAIKRMKKK